METYKINFANHIKAGYPMILVGLLCFFTPSILFWLQPDQRYPNEIYVGLVVFSFLALPALVLHLNYYLINVGDVVRFSRLLNEITYIHKGQATRFLPNDIDHVVWSVSFNEFENRIGIVPWEKYNHYVIYLINGKVITITSLLVPDLVLPIDEEKILVKRNFYRLAKIR